MRLNSIRPIKKFLAKQMFMHYHFFHREFAITYQVLSTLLLFCFSSVAFQSNTFAAQSKEKIAEEYRLNGYEAQQKGNLDEALTNYIKAASLSPAPASLFNDMGVTYEKLNLPEKAEESYLEAIRVDEKYLPAYANLAYLYEAKGDVQKAAEYLKKRIQEGDPQDIWTRKAKENLHRLARKSPALKKWLQKQEVAELTGELETEAKEDFTKRVAKANGFYKEGQKSAKEKSYREAIDQYNQALSFTPDNPKITTARDQAILQYAKQQLQQHTDSALKMLDLGDTVSARVEIQKMLTEIPSEPIQTK